MIIAYKEVYVLPQEPGQPELCVCESGRFLLTLRTTDFEVKFVDGKAEINLTRSMSAEEIKTMGKMLIDEADASVAAHEKWEAECAALNKRR